MCALGKSLFTSIRELVENSLDATEAISVLPNIIVQITEFDETEHNSMHGITNKTGNLFSFNYVTLLMRLL